MDVQTSYNGEIIHSGRGKLSTNNVGADFVIIPNIIVTVTEEGELKFKAKLGSDRWKVVTTIPLRKNV